MVSTFMCMFLCTKPNTSQLPVGSSGLHHLYPNTDLQPHSKALHKCDATKLLKVFFLHLMNTPLTEFERFLGTMCSNTQTSCSFAIYSPVWAAVQAACPAYSWASSLASYLCPPEPSLLVGFQAAFWELMENKVLREENGELAY